MFKTALYTIRNLAKLATAVVTAGVYALIPRRVLGADRPFQRRGIRLIKHDSHSRSGVVYALQFNSGAGYIGGATAYLGLGCRVRASHSGFKAVRFAVGLTNNGNNTPLAGRY